MNISVPEMVIIHEYEPNKISKVKAVIACLCDRSQNNNVWDGHYTYGMIAEAEYGSLTQESFGTMLARVIHEAQNTAADRYFEKEYGIDLNSLTIVIKHDVFLNDHVTSIRAYIAYSIKGDTTPRFYLTVK